MEHFPQKRRFWFMILFWVMVGFQLSPVDAVLENLNREHSICPGSDGPSGEQVSGEVSSNKGRMTQPHRLT